MQLTVSTRKGLFVLAQRDSRWQIVGRHFLGEPVTAVLCDTRSKRWIAALRTGHFGIKMRASDDAGATWQEIVSPTDLPSWQAN